MNLLDVAVCSRAMSSSSAKEQFLRQMEQIVEGIKQNRIKVCTGLQQSVPRVKPPALEDEANVEVP